MSDLLARVAELLRSTDGWDRPAFLGAQFDAGLAWVHHPVGAGGLALAPARQAEVDTALLVGGRLESWQRNPMGIGMVAPALVGHGSVAQLALLRPIFTGQDVWCQLFSEPGAGSDLASLATRAERDGDEWVLTGQKVWTSLAHTARFGLALARTDPQAPKHAGLTAFVVDMGAAGVQLRPLRDLTGGTHFNEVFLDRVRVGEADRVGPVGAGWTVATTMLTNERTVIGADAQERGAGAIAVAVATWRSTGADPTRRLELARLWVEAEVLRIASHRQQDGSGLKLRRAELEQRIARFTVELLGPAGTVYTGELNSPLWTWLQSQAYTIAGGTSDILRTVIGERVLGLPKEPGPPRTTPWSELPR